MSLYPNIESLTMDTMAQAQASFVHNVQSSVSAAPHYPAIAANAANTSVPGLYSGLYSDLGLDDYMGISLALAGSQNPYLYNKQDEVNNMQLQSVGPRQVANIQTNSNNTVALNQAQAGYKRAEIKDGVRQLILCKDAVGKVGISVQSVNKGIFVTCVWIQSPAALSGIRVGDQILQIDGESVAGYTEKQVLKLLSAANPARVSLVVRDRPFERTIILTKNSTDHLGFVFKKGKITKVAKDTSAARNGLLTEHHFLEINGVNVIGFDDDAISKAIADAGDVVTLTIMPSVIYETMMKNISSKVLRQFNDHSVPEL